MNLKPIQVKYHFQAQHKENILKRIIIYVKEVILGWHVNDNRSTQVIWRCLFNKGLWGKVIRENYLKR